MRDASCGSLQNCFASIGEKLLKAGSMLSATINLCDVIIEPTKFNEALEVV